MIDVRINIDLRKYLLIFTVLALLSCKKDKDAALGGFGCKFANYNAYSTTTFFIPDTSALPNIPFSYINPKRGHRINPSFNPNNSNQVVYEASEDFYGTFARGLYYFDFCTGKEKYITRGERCDWSSKGWIAFTGSTNHIHKIKSNGDSLTQLTNVGHDFNAKWSPDGSRLFYYSGGNTYTTNANGQGNQAIFTASVWPVAWIDNETILAIVGDFFFVHHLGTSITSGPINALKVKNNGFQAYDPDNNICYAPIILGSKRYFLKYDFTKNTVDTLHSGNDKCYYGSASYSKQSKTIIATLGRSYMLDTIPTFCDLEFDLLFLDSKGKNARLIEVP